MGGGGGGGGFQALAGQAAVAVLSVAIAASAFVKGDVPTRFMRWYHLTRHNLETIYDNRWYEWNVGGCDAAERIQDDAGDASLPDRVNVVYAATENEFPGLLSSMLSLSRHLTQPENCHIHILVAEADVYQASRLVECFQMELGSSRPAPHVRVLETSPLPLNISGFEEVWSEKWPEGVAFFTSLSFVALYLPEYFPEEPRVLWIEPDTIVRADVARLYRVRMGTPLAAALDMKAVTWRSAYVDILDELDQLEEPWWRALRIDVDSRTLNSGVLVLDLRRWRAENVTGKLETWVRRVRGVKVAQLAFNLEFHRRFDVLDWRWNVMGLMAAPPDRCLEQARILHWAETVRPWSKQVPTLPERMQSLYKNLTGAYEPRTACDWRDGMLDSDV